MNYCLNKKSGLFLMVSCFIILLTYSCRQVPTGEASSDKYRLVWNTDPTTSVTLAWDQLQISDAEVYFGTKDRGRKYWKYKQKVAPSAGNNKYEMNTQFALLENLHAGTNYYFVVKNKFGVSKRY